MQLISNIKTSFFCITDRKLAVFDSIIKTGNRIREAAVGVLDLKPDNFAFNFNGRSGKFVIDATANNKAHIIPFQPLQITYPKRLDANATTPCKYYDPDNKVSISVFESDAAIAP